MVFHIHSTHEILDSGDYIFPADGAFPYKRDLKNVEFNLLDTGHFALEEDGKLQDRLFNGFLSVSQPEIDLDFKGLMFHVVTTCDLHTPANT